MFVVGSVAICRATACATCGFACPTIAGPAEPDIVSRYIWPAESHTRAFSPRTSVRHGSLRSECSTYRLSASTSVPPRSGAQPARGHLPDGLHPAAADPDDLVGQVAAGAGVERVETQLLTQRDGGAVGRVAHSVLLGQPLDHDPAVRRVRLRRVEDVPGADHAPVAGERLRPAVDR